WNPLSVTPARLSGAPAAPPLVMPELPEMISTRCIEVLIRPSIRGGITTVRRTVFPLGGGGGGGGGGVAGPAGEDEPRPARRRAMPTASAVGGRRMRAPIKGPASVPPGPGPVNAPVPATVWPRWGVPDAPAAT